MATIALVLGRGRRDRVLDGGIQPATRATGYREPDERGQTMFVQVIRGRTNDAEERCSTADGRQERCRSRTRQIVDDAGIG
jgi:hypothetical protein